MFRRPMKPPVGDLDKDVTKDANPLLSEGTSSKQPLGSGEPGARGESCMLLSHTLHHLFQLSF